MANILTLMGSPRINGNTDLLTDAFIEGARENGHNITKISVYKNKVNACINCSYCCNHDGECFQKDGMDEIYSLLDNAEIVVFASPLYFYNLSAQLKAIIDRFHAKTSVKKLKPKKCVLLAVGADDASAFDPMISTYKAIANYLKWEDIGILTVDNIEEKGAITKTDALKRAKALGSNIK